MGKTNGQIESKWSEIDTVILLPLETGMKERKMDGGTQGHREQRGEGMM